MFQWPWEILHWGSFLADTPCNEENIHTRHGVSLCHGTPSSFSYWALAGPSLHTCVLPRVSPQKRQANHSPAQHHKKALSLQHLECEVWFGMLLGWFLNHEDCFGVDWGKEQVWCPLCLLGGPAKHQWHPHPTRTHCWIRHAQLFRGGWTPSYPWPSLLLAAVSKSQSWPFVASWRLLCFQTCQCWRPWPPMLHSPMPKLLATNA